MTSSFTDRQHYFVTKLKEYAGAVNQHLVRTPERSLEQAYQAALNIKTVENDYFKGGKIPTESVSQDGYLASSLRTDFEKNLGIVKIRLAEFRASCFVLGSLSSNHLAKLRFVDVVLAKYTTESSNSSALVTVSKSTKPIPGKANNQLYPSTIDINVDFITDKKGVLPRSIERTISKLANELNPKTEKEVIHKFRSSRNKTVIAVKFLATLIAVPLLTQQLSKHYIVSPIVEQVRGENQAQVFLNAEMKEEALKELHTFEETLKFESLVNVPQPLSSEEIEERVKHKAAAIAKDYRDKSNSAISNVFADLLALGSFGLVLLVSRREIFILKSFMDDIVYGLSDSAKAFIIILFTDIFVGFHSPHGWEVLLESIAFHLGIPANKSLIFLFIATFPVILDTIFKYWIFRYLSKVSPSAVATLRNMNE